ncbi:hypothetical protein A343_0394 [Porphyromonas gingivalis JCVI SC001]|nr:hypothetical protein A343_0394 [Porphyromonas gingivalis JCVI SC001]
MIVVLFHAIHHGGKHRFLGSIRDEEYKTVQNYTGKRIR